MSSLSFAARLENVETSAIRELFKVLGRPGMISFAGGFPDPALFDVEGIELAVQRTLKEDPSRALQYGATEGYEPLRTELAALMQGRGADVSPDQLLVTTGSQQALDLIAKTLINPGDTVIVEAPTFLAAIQCFRLYGANVISVPMDRDGIDVNALKLLVQTQRPKFVYLVPTFGNPSGSVLSLERRLRILDIAHSTGTLVVEDDPYGELYFDEPPPASLLALSQQVPGSRDWVAHCGSMSKILSPGLRVGWLIATSDLLSRAVMCKQFSDAHTSTMCQAIVAQYLRGGGMPSALAKVRSAYASRAAAMTREIRRQLGDRLKFDEPRGGLFVWATLTGVDRSLNRAGELAVRALQRQVAFVPGMPFYASDPDLSALRLSFATVDTKSIEEGVNRMRLAFQAT